MSTVLTDTSVSNNKRILDTKGTVGYKKQDFGIIFIMHTVHN